MNLQKILSTIFAFFVVVLFSACNSIRILQGEGVPVLRVFDTDAFHAINLSGFFAIDFTRADDFSVRIVMQENLLERHEVQVRNGNLTISNNIRGGVSFGYTPRMYIFAPYLTHITLAGSVIAINWDEIRTDSLDITTSGFASLDIPINVEHLTINASGSSILQLSGIASYASVNITGFVNVIAQELRAESVEINGSGSARMNITVSNNLDVDLRGFANVQYIGNPTIASRFSGSARLERIDE